MLERIKAIKEERADARAYSELQTDDIPAMMRKKRGKEAVEEVIRIPEDVRNDKRYEGQTVFMFKFVPMNCVDEKTAVDQAALREYLLCAMIEEDPVVKKFQQTFAKSQEKIDAVDRKIKAISKMEFLAEDNKTPLPPDKASEQRALLFEQCGEERLQMENELKEKKHFYEVHISSRRNMGIEMTQGKRDENTDTCSWYFRFFGGEDSQLVEELLIKKKNWTGIKLAGGGIVTHKGQEVRVPPWAARANSVPTGKKIGEYDLRRLEILMDAVRIMRVPAGVGLFKKLDRKSSSIFDEEFGMFYGEFESGRRDGYGIDINDTGVFAGRYLNGFRYGNGRMDFADGTTVTASFNLLSAKELDKYETSGFENPYRDGEANGMVEIHFADGGFYKGFMQDGIINGQGDYQSAMNEVFSGNFKDGILHGSNCFWQNIAEDVYTGNFVNGELFGKGTYMGKNGDSYIGYWDSHQKHGRGITVNKRSCCHRGYYVNSFYHGKGSIEFGTKRMTIQKYKDEILQSKAAVKAKRAESTSLPSSSTTTKESLPDSRPTPSPEKSSESLKEEDSFVLSDFDKMYQGFFVGSIVSNGGSVMDTKYRIPTNLSRLNKVRTQPIEKAIEKENRRRKETQRILEKFADMEIFIRGEITTKKIRIYNQQKHYTKKTMYAEDTVGYLNKMELDSKMILRKERLGSLTEDTHFFKKAIVPRLREMDTSAVDHFTRAFERIKPNKNDLKKEDRVKDRKVRIAMSDFEEVAERQRFLKYDMIWQRAEEAFVQKKKSVIE